MGYSRGNIPFALKTLNRNFYSNILRSGVPVLDQDINIQQRIVAERVQDVFNLVSTSGWITQGSFHSYGENTMKINSSEFVVEGLRCILDGSFTIDNQITFLNASDTINRFDLVWVEVWLHDVSGTDTIYPYGNVNYYGDGLSNDVIDPAIGLAATHRIQVRFRIRVSQEAEDPEDVFAQGANDTPSTTSFTYDSTNDFWYANTGESKYSVLEGKVYAVPICKVFRPIGDNTIISGNIDELRNYCSLVNSLVNTARADATLSGAPKIFSIKDENGTLYYFKAYPTET